MTSPVCDLLSSTANLLSKSECRVKVFVMPAVPVLWSLKWLEKQEQRSWLLCPRSSEDPTEPAIESKDMVAVDEWSDDHYRNVSSVEQPIDDTGSRNWVGRVHTVALKNETPNDLVYLHTPTAYVWTPGMRPGNEGDAHPSTFSIYSST